MILTDHMKPDRHWTQPSVQAADMHDGLVILVAFWEGGGFIYDSGPYKFGRFTSPGGGGDPSWSRGSHGMGGWFPNASVGASSSYRYQFSNWGGAGLLDEWITTEFTTLCFFRSTADGNNSHRRVWHVANNEFSFGYQNSTNIWRFVTYEGGAVANLDATPVRAITDVGGHASCCSWRSSYAKHFALDGRVFASAGSVAAGTISATGVLSIGGHSNDKDTNAHMGLIYLFAMWNKYTPAEGCAALTRDPYAIIRPRDINRPRLSYAETIAPTTVGTAALGTVSSRYRTIAPTTSGTAVVSTASSWYRTIAATTVGTAVLTTIATWARTIAASTVGTAVLSTIATWARAIAPTTVGTATVSTVASWSRTIAATTVGTAVVTRAVQAYRTIAATAVGVAGLAKTSLGITYQVVTATATGVATIARLVPDLVTVAATATGRLTIKVIQTIGGVRWIASGPGSAGEIRATMTVNPRSPRMEAHDMRVRPKV